MKTLVDLQAELCGVRKQIAGMLLQHARSPGGCDPGPSQSGIAAILGIPRAFVKDSFSFLVNVGAIRLERNRMIINIKTLERIAMNSNSARAYVLLRTRECDLAEIAAIVRQQPGVIMADQIEGPADVIFAVQACDRESLAALTVQAIAAVEDRTEDVQLLPAKEETFAGG